MARDLLLNDIPAPLKNVEYLVVCLLMDLLGLLIYRYLESKEEWFRTRALAYFKSFTLPWFAILGAHKALDHGLGVFAAIVIGVISTTAGDVMIDLFSGVTPEFLGPQQQGITAAILAAGVYTIIAIYYKGRESFFPVTLTAVAVSFSFRVFAVREHWPSIVPCDPPAAGPRT